MDLHKELGVEGWCFRNFKDNTTVAEKVKACGLDRIDLSGCQLKFKDASDVELCLFQRLGQTNPRTPFCDLKCRLSLVFKVTY